MTLDAIIARQAELRPQIEELGEAEQLDEDQEARWMELNAEWDELAEAREKAEARANRIEFVRSAALDPRNVEPGGSREDVDPSDAEGSPVSRAGRRPWDREAIERAQRLDPDARGRELSARALDAVEAMRGISDANKDRVTSLIERDANSDGAAAGKFATEVLVTSDPEYVRAFGRMIRSFVRTGTPDLEAQRQVQRALSLTDGEGGFRVPLPIDPTVINLSDGAANPFRAISDVRTATTDVVRTVRHSAVTASWDGEAAEVSDDAPTFTNVDITLHKAQAFIPFSIELQADYPGLQADMASALTDARDTLESAAFATGTGTDQPVGIVTALTGGSQEISSNTTDVFALGDVYDLEEELPAKYTANASWVANKRIYQAIREAGGANLDDFWQNLGGGRPRELLGYPAFESSDMDGTIDAAADNRVLILGDFRMYRIYDRVGLTIELVPHLFATANNLPDGQRGFYAYWRVGADSVKDEAFRMLNVT